MNRPRIRVVVVNHNGGEITLRCLDALARSTWPADALEVVLVDNASTDGVVVAVAADHPSVRVLLSAVNEGFGRACNRAMQDLTGIDHVALVNNDAVPEPSWLEPLLEAMEADPGVGAVCPKILLARRARGIVIKQEVEQPAILTIGDVTLGGVSIGGLVVADERFRAVLGGRPHRWSTGRGLAGLWWSDGGCPSADPVHLTLTADRAVPVSVESPAEHVVVNAGPSPVSVEVALPTEPQDVLNSVGGVLYEGWFGGDRGYLELDRGQYDQPAEVFSWSGAGVLLRADYLRDVGLFNPAFFLYYEDFELSWRGRLKGWRYATAPASVLRHEHGFTTGIGSQAFRTWEDRSRRLALIELAPTGAAARAAAGGIWHTRPIRQRRAFLTAAVRAARSRARYLRGHQFDASRWLRPRPGAW